MSYIYIYIYLTKVCGGSIRIKTKWQLTDTDPVNVFHFCSCLFSFLVLWTSGYAARQDVMTALYVIFLGIVPCVALVAIFMYYTRRNIKYWWKKSSGHPGQNVHPPSYVTCCLCSSVCGCLGRSPVSKLRNFNFGVGNICTLQTTHLPRHGMPRSNECNVSTVPPQVKLEITKTDLISTTNSDVMNTLKSIKNTQNTDNSPSSRKEHLNKGVTLTVDNLLQPPASKSVPISIRREVFMKSTIKANCMPQIHIPATSIVSSNTTIAEPSPSTSKSGSQNARTHFSSSTSKSVQPKKIRKNSKNLQLRVTLDPVKQQLIETSDSCQSSPETPPMMKLQKSQVESYPSRPTVAELSSKFEKGNVSKT